jgi:hypothetical protein
VPKIAEVDWVRSYHQKFSSSFRTKGNPRFLLPNKTQSISYTHDAGKPILDMHSNARLPDNTKICK